MKYLIYALLAITLIVIFISAKRTHKPFKTVFFSALGGIASMMAVNIFSGLTGVGIAVNAVTVGCSAVLGVCGTIMMLILRIVAK